MKYELEVCALVAHEGADEVYFTELRIISEPGGPCIRFATTPTKDKKEATWVLGVLQSFLKEHRK